MKFGWIKTIWKTMATRVWLIVTAALSVLLILVNCLASVTFYDAVCTFLGGSTMTITGEEWNLFDKDFASKAEATANGNKITVEICEEGFTLLKNNDEALPLSAGAKISVFGKNSVNIAAGGSGSGGGVTAEVDVFDSLKASGFEYNETLKSFYEDNSRSGDGRDSNPSDLDSGKEVTLSEGETPKSSYTSDIWDSCAQFKDAAIIVLTRINGEGFDLPRNADGSHYLQISKNEQDLIDAVTAYGFGTVIVMINSASTMEVQGIAQDDGIDAILWTGYAGGQGLTALGEILKGEKLDGTKLSPSGKTVDTYAAHFMNNPTWANFGAALGGDAYQTTSTDKRTGEEKVSDEQIYFVDYEEGIYVGYRYYETAYAEALAGNYSSFEYDKEVVYPFGYGLTYSEFEWVLKNADELQNVKLYEDTSMTFEVEVFNTGDYPASDVVEIYVTPPYTKGGIEKSAKVLVGFAKTDVIAVGESDTVEITVDSPYAYASYDYADRNNNGFKGYEVEAGDYIFTISTDAHNAKIDGQGQEMTVTANAADSIRYETDPVTGTVVGNLYADNQDETTNSDYELGSVLSRSDFVGTWPQTRTAAERDVTGQQDWINAITSTNADPNRPTGNDVMPATGKHNNVKFADLIGVDYNDPLWDEFLDQLTVREMASLINRGAFGTVDVARLGVPQTLASDGPVGFVNFMGVTAIYGCAVYPCEVVISSTWNIDLVYEMGEAVGNEGLMGNEKEDGMPYSGWYAPGLNIHRSPFGGRNFEYYSEDSLVTGMMASSIVRGCASKGVYVTLKHFALNEQETHRAINGVLTWATEQSMRELYLKSFEVAIKTSMQSGVKTMGVMSSFNRIGSRWTGGDYRLLTNILREEWGYEGLVISDFNTCSHMVEANMFYAGGDLDLQILGIIWTPDKNNATDVTVARNAAHNILYTIVNSNAMRGDFEIHLPAWQVVMFVVDAVLIAGLAVWGTLVLLRTFKAKKPENGTEESSAPAETGGESK